MRRLLPTLLAISFALPILGQSAPVFDPGGPDAAAYGQAAGYPKTTPNDGNVEQRFMVGTSSHWDELVPVHHVTHGQPWPFRRASAEPAIHYDYAGKSCTLTDFLAHVPVTGLLIVQDDTILAEHYQYARTDRDRFTGNSMTKTLITLLMGTAVASGRIKSIDDKAETYLPSMRGTSLGETPLRALLEMSSGVELNEDKFYGDFFKPKEDTAASLTGASKRAVPPFTRFKYSCGDSETLTTVLRRVTGRELATELSEKIWKPLGAESDAGWVIGSSGQEVSCWGLSATLRDYGRLGRLFAWDGSWNGRQLIPKEWMLQATTIRPEDKQVAPGTAAHYYGYGYQLWILPGERRMFALMGSGGQYIFVDPKSKLVLVQTAVRNEDTKVTSPRIETLALWLALVRQFG